MPATLLKKRAAVGAPAVDPLSAVELQRIRKVGEALGIAAILVRVFLILSLYVPHTNYSVFRV